MTMSFDDALIGIAARAGEHDRSGLWPAEDLAALAAAGSTRWEVPAEYGGDPPSALDLHLRYERLATASVATALVLTQRDAAVGLVDAAVGAPEREPLLRRFAENGAWATVGIAQLTTSRQGGPPAVRAERVDGGYRLDGVIPWSTGAARSDFVVAGAVLPDRNQVLVLLPSDLPGVRPAEPMRMVALSQTMTGAVHLDGVRVDDRLVLRPPCENALAGRRKGLTLAQTFVATGLCRAATDLIAAHDSDRARTLHGRLAAQLEAVRAEVHALCQPGREAAAAAANARLRGTCNDLAVRATHAAVALYKGTALLLDHPAQRLAREAMFLLVWSCPNPVIDCTVDTLATARVTLDVSVEVPLPRPEAVQLARSSTPAARKRRAEQIRKYRSRLKLAGV